MEEQSIPIGMLLQKAAKIRAHILEMVAEAKSGHPGGSLSAVEILVSLFFYKMRHDLKRPDWPDRDRFVLSKGEAAMAAPKFKLDNLTAIIDRNGIQQDGLTEQIMPMEPVGYKWKAFNWHVLEVDGFDFRQVIDALEKAESMRNRPTVIIAHTIKGKGVSFMEWDPAYHGKAPDKDTVRKLVKTMLEE